MIALYYGSEISTDLMSSIKVYITSKYNKDGVLLTYWLDGDNLEFVFERDSYTEIALQEKETIYLKEKTVCSTKEGYLTFVHIVFHKPS